MADRKHKYYAKVKLSPKKTRYFYSKDEYLAYLNAKKGGQEDKSKGKSSLLDFLKKTTKSIEKKVSSTKKSLSSFMSKGKKAVSKILNSGIKSVKLSSSSLKSSISKGKKSLSKIISGANKTLSKKVSSTKRSVSKKISVGKQKCHDAVHKSDLGKATVKSLKNGKKYAKKVEKALSKSLQTLSDKAKPDDPYEAFKKKKTKKDPEQEKEALKKAAEEFIHSEKPSNWGEVKKKTKKSTEEEDMEAINPYYETRMREYYTNCTYCTAAYDLRRRGYDVQAAARDEKADLSANGIADLYDGEKLVTDYDLMYKNASRTDKALYKLGIKDPPKTNTKEFNKALEKDLLSHGDGARGHLIVQWENGGAHDVVWEVEDGKVYARDCQSNKVYDLEKYTSRSSKINYFRTDNIKPNKKVLNFVVNRRKEGRK